MTHVDAGGRVVEVPHVRILLATRNGSRWIDEQINSIALQRNVRVSIVASDDQSTDETVDRLRAWQPIMEVAFLPAVPYRFGNANRNFLRLVRDAPLADAAFIAFSDQDDIWLSDKLSRALHCLGRFRADAYSSDAMAFWPDGRQRRIDKSGRQRLYDHLFESPGAGSTFVFTRRAFDELRVWVTAKFDRLQDAKVHDWLIYAYARASGWRWQIDSHAGLLYRQHDGNEIGANVGWRSALHRIRQIRDGRYRAHVLANADLVGIDSAAVRAIRRLTIADRVWLVLHATQCRRRMIEQVMFAIAAVLMPRDRSAGSASDSA